MPPTTCPVAPPTIDGQVLASTTAGIMSVGHGSRAAGRPTTAQYITGATDATLTAEKVLTENTASGIDVTIAGHRRRDGDGGVDARDAHAPTSCCSTGPTPRRG